MAALVAAKAFYPSMNGLNTVPVVGFFGGEKIVMRNRNELLAKLVEMKKRKRQFGVDIVSDFDQTISAFYDDRQRAVSASFGIFRGSTSVPQNVTDKSKQLYQYYYKYEISNEYSMETKQEKMNEWLKESMKLIFDNHIDSQLLGNMINENVFAFRHGFDSFFKYAFKNNLNFFVLSAGIQDVIYYLLNQIELVKQYQQLQLISNKIIFDESGQAIGAGEQMVHSMNKESVLDRNSYPQLNQNCLLFGDMLHDSLMTRKASYANQIKIGFAKNEKDIDNFLKKFDIVCHDQGSFLVAEYLLRKIIHPEEPIPEELQQKMLAINRELVETIEESTQERL